MNKAKEPKVLIYDIETKPIKVWTFRVGNNLHISHENIVDGERFDIICICYKWIGESKVHALTWDKNQNSAAMIEAFSKEIEKADLVLGHNSDRFDMLNINTQRWLHKQQPISWPSKEDMLKQFRSVFYLPSNRLDYLSKLTGGPGKNRMSFGDWVDIVQNKSDKALRKMVKYCKRDVSETARIFELARPHLKLRVNPYLTEKGEIVCPVCGGKDFKKKGLAYNAASLKQRIVCTGCGKKLIVNREVVK